MSNQELQDKYGYVVMGWTGYDKLAVGDVLPRARYRDEWEGPFKWLELPLVVVGFGTIEEWRKHCTERGDAHCYDWSLAETCQIVKVMAE